MSVRANWGLQALAVAPDEAQVDPFDSTSSAVMAGGTSTDWRASVGFDTPREELQSRLAFLIRREGVYFDAGVTCPVKDNPESSCLACPFSQAEKPDGERCQLCRIGIDQERISTLLVAQTAAAAYEQEHGVGRQSRA